jgi:hypothetical protein
MRPRPKPQDSTACLGNLDLNVDFPLLPMAGCTDDASTGGCLLVNVPHSGACPTEDESLGTGRMDRHEAGHMAP